ncbi:MAG TPA: penicillin-binding transpeptidase domain-containing protein [Candidatus Kapabacteria bacterium]|nr:penicillin-binding transpeptidase domain-containing protein [Candidatus Kapabacteria bacterium]
MRGAGGYAHISPEAPSSFETSEKKTVWHQRLIERFFAAPAVKDPMKTNARLYLILGIFLIGFLAVVFKLFKVQVLDHDELSEQAASQYKMEVALPARRGVITDRNGVILASNSFVVKFAVDPQEIKNKPALAAAFSSVFNKPKEFYSAILNDTSRRYIVVEKEVPLDVAAKLESIKERGLLRETDERRAYAFGGRASHILGFTSKDGRGLAGLELFDNAILRGKDGTSIMQRDGRGKPRPDVDYEQTPAVNGDDLTLTIDETIQSITENALHAGVESANAEAGIAIVMNPRTGEILSLANVPDFNPNDFFAATNEQLRNRAITDAFEPGSTMKVLTAAIALEEKAWKPEDKIDAKGGTWEIEGGAKIRDTHKYGVLTFRQALEKSSNVCFAQISDKLDRRRFYKYMRDFGISVLTGIDLPGEIKGTLHKPSRWSVNSKRYVAFGYEMSATPIQLASAYAAIANNGVMMKPYIIAKRRQANGEIIENKPQELRRVVSEQTSKTLISIMRGVVDSGTATLCKIKGVAIAGKTGTAQQLVNGHYSKEHYTSTFIGFFPAEDPQYEILVILRSPHNGYYGGAVSGPIFRQIALSILEQTGKLPPDARAPMPVIAQDLPEEGGELEIDGTILRTKDRDDNPDRDMPDVRGLAMDLARRVLGSQGFSVEKNTDKGVVERVVRFGGDSVRLILRAGSSAEQSSLAASPVAEAPNFLGMPMARAMKYAAASNVRLKFVGDGSVVRQTPEAGAVIDASNPTITLFGDE